MLHVDSAIVASLGVASQYADEDGENHPKRANPERRR
jgi:hypothetical protein